MPDKTETPSDVVQTTSGKVRGAINHEIAVFKGIPYAADTSGAGRFRRSKAPAAWSGVRDMLRYGPQCPQVGILATGLYGAAGKPPPESEDCLFLNIFTPSTDDTRRPVMVWLHGGAFENGSGSGLWYNGVNLARRGDVVVVTINHRLNVFGFAYLAELCGGDFADSGHAGLLDIIDALKWVRDNIAAFGGDPNRVTLFGESGGGRKISVLCAMPEAKGLFHRGIIQSGSALRMRPPEEATANTARFLRELDIKPSEAAAKLPDLSTREILEAGLRASGVNAMTLISPGSFLPVRDGKHIPRDPFDTIAPPEAAGVPLVIGWTRTETSRLIGARDDEAWGLDDAGLRRKLASHVPAESVDGVVAAFKKANPDASPTDLFFLVTTATSVRAEVQQQLDLRNAAGGAPTYAWCLAWETPVEGGKWKSPHALDVPFVFDNVAYAPTLTGPETDETRAVADAMTGAWIAFARTGNPATPTRSWPAYTPATRAVMVFDARSEAVPGVYDDERQAIANAGAVMPWRTG